jgi:DNA-binding SARP family transcriptional activator
MDFRMLGSLEVWSDTGRRIVLSSGRQERVLAALLLASGTAVPLQRLVEATWDYEAPATAAKQVRNCVSALRERLGGGTALIATDGPGYRIDVSEARLDAVHFRSGVTRALRRAGEGDHRGAIVEMREALELWRGPALDGVEAVALVGSVARLNEERINAIERLADWRLELGERGAVIEELTDVVARYPLRESAYARLMRALSGAGRRADALALFHTLRARLVDELGVEPGEESRAVFARILSEPTDRPVSRHAAAAAFPASVGNTDQEAHATAAVSHQQTAAETRLYCAVCPGPAACTGATACVGHGRTTAVVSQAIVATAPRVDHIRDAIPLYERALRDRQQVLSEDHPDTLVAAHNLATAYESADRFDEAIELHQQTLIKRQRVLGASHEQTLSSANNLASAYESAGRFDEAIQLHQQTLTDHRRLLGEDHPYTTTSINNLAYAYYMAHRLEEAIPLYEANLTKHTQTLGEHHRVSLTSANNLACAYREAGRFQEAIPLHEQALTNHRRLFGDDHHHTLSIANNLVTTYYAAGRHDDAHHLHQHTLATAIETLGEEHPLIQTIRQEPATR